MRGHPSCNANQGYHRTVRANLNCPYHRAIAIANNPELDVAGAKKSNSVSPFGALNTTPPQDRLIVVEDVDGFGRATVTKTLAGKEHCEEGPAVSQFRAEEEGVGVSVEKFRRNGEPYPSDGKDGPSLIRYGTDGEVEGVDWEGDLSVARGAKDLPDSESSSGVKHWRKAGRLHREGGRPATVNSEGFGTQWCVDGNAHRTDGPASVSKGWSAYWLDGLMVDREDVWARYLEQECGLDINNREAQDALWSEPTDPEQTFINPTPEQLALISAVYTDL